MSSTMTRLPPLAHWAPWTDRRGRVHPLRTVVFIALLLPAAWLAVRWSGGMLGARPLNAAMHSTGYWAAWVFVASLVVTPAKALLGMPNLVVVRRMIGNASLCYVALHVVLYIFDQNWRLLTVVTEIATRAYLTIGFVALLGLVALAITSTDGWVKRLGSNWKRLHKLAYGIGVLAMIHFFLQSKLDVSQATVAAGVFAWLMIWRVLPAGRDRGPVPLLGLAIAAAAATLAFEGAWYCFGTKVDPMRVISSEADFDFGLHPAALVLLLGLLVAGLVELRALALTRFGASVWYTVLVYVTGGLLGDVAGFAMGWSFGAEGEPALAMTAAWFALFAVLGLLRHGMQGGWPRHVVDALGAAAALSPVITQGEDGRPVIVAAAAVMITGVLMLARRFWPLPRKTEYAAGRLDQA